MPCSRALSEGRLSPVMKFVAKDAVIAVRNCFFLFFLRVGNGKNLVFCNLWRFSFLKNKNKSGGKRLGRLLYRYSISCVCMHVTVDVVAPPPAPTGLHASGRRIPSLCTGSRALGVLGLFLPIAIATRVILPVYPST